MSRTRGTADALAGSVEVAPWPRPARDLPRGVGPYVAAEAGEWPRGIHWTPGEVRSIPPSYPCAEPPPAWLSLAGAS